MPYLCVVKLILQHKKNLMKKINLAVLFLCLILFSGCHSFYKIDKDELQEISAKDEVQIKFKNGNTINITNIQYFNITKKLLLSPNRTKKVAFARQIAMFLGREYTNLSLAQIGQELGGRDHSTVIYACEKIRKEMVENPYVELTIKNLSKLIT